MSETEKKTRNTLNKKLEAVGAIETIKSYTSTYNEEANRKRLAPFVAQGVITTEALETMIAAQKAKFSKKPDGSEMQVLKQSVFEVCNEHFAVPEETERERVSLKDALHGLYFKTIRLQPEAHEVLFAVEGYIAEQERKQAEALKKLAAAK